MNIIRLVVASFAATLTLHCAFTAEVGLSFKADCGVLSVSPIAEGALRVRCAPASLVPLPEMVLLPQKGKVRFSIRRSGQSETLTTSRIVATFNRGTGALQFSDPKGRILLEELPGGRSVKPSSVQSQPTLISEDRFRSPPDEHLFGSGQFQDVFLDIRDLPRRLTQVNTQISIPFLFSSKGYGLFWHNYGLTDLNPAGNHMEPTREAVGGTTADAATTTRGNTHSETDIRGIFRRLRSECGGEIRDDARCRSADGAPPPCRDRRRHGCGRDKYLAPAQLYWKNFSRRMLSLGIDAWWQDATEPENDALAGQQTFAGPGDRYRLTYPLLVTKTVYEGQRKDAPDKRVMILTRSAYPGEQRYAAATWSGDVGNDWETLRRQITGGLDYSVTGMPYWTTDAGGFFRPGPGQYDDPAYRERFLRWLQFATFSPLMRVHGYQTKTEPWRYGEEVERETRRWLDQRHRLLPYIYSEAAEVTLHGSTLMRPLVMDFPDDDVALKQKHEYMFGKSILVAPVLQPGVNEWPVYTPSAPGGWWDWWTEKKVDSKATVPINAPISQLPLLVRAGSIIPFGPVEQYAGQDRSGKLELRLYPGADAEFTLYEDEGVNYAYEKVARATISFHWSDATKTLSIGDRKGTFPGMLTDREFTVHLAGSDSSHDKPVAYSGRHERLRLE